MKRKEKKNWYIDHSLFNHVDHDLNRIENNINTKSIRYKIIKIISIIFFNNLAEKNSR
jgi:hypothetical protein